MCSSVHELGWDVLRERNHQVSIQCNSDPGEGIDTVSCSPTLLKTGYHGLGCANTFGELTPAETRLGTQVIDQLAEREIPLDTSPGVSVRRRLTLLDVVPKGNSSPSSSPSGVLLSTRVSVSTHHGRGAPADRAVKYSCRSDQMTR